jgi:hypothetical protein
MKLSPEKMTKAVSGIDRLIGNIPEQNLQTIRSVFFLVMFGLVVGGVIYGVMKGKEAAEIKSAPIIERTNDTFEQDIKREREGGNFTSMLDAEVINEMKKIDMGKIQFPSRTNMEPDTEKGIIEPPTNRKVRESPDVRVQDPLFEGDNKTRPKTESDVRPLEKWKNPAPGDRESIMESEKKELSPLPERESRRKPDIRKQDSDVRPLEKKRTSRGSDIRSQEPLHHNEGIIGD